MITKRYFIGTPSPKAGYGWPMAFSTGSTDVKDYSITTNGLKADEVPDPCNDAKTFAEFMAGLLNAFYSGVDVSKMDHEEVMKMGMDSESLGIPHPDNTEIPFPPSEPKDRSSKDPE